jgi:hypothetical protein
VASLFSYLDLDQHDPVTVRSDGLLMRLTPTAENFFTNASGEYWGLYGITPLGSAIATLDRMRISDTPDRRIHTVDVSLPVIGSGEGGP